LSKFTELQLSGFLEALASPNPTPGGGTASAIAGAMGASLLMMVAGLSKSRTGGEEGRVALAEAGAALASVRDRLAALAETDAEAFDGVMAAYRLPKSTDEEKTARNAAIQQGLKAATTTPLDTLRVAAEAMHLAVSVATHGSRAAASDVGVAVSLLEAAAEGATANVLINLESLGDEAFKASATADVDEINARLKTETDAARAQLAS
jgi:methenyltetrahydrofolate cyclohydrolase